MNKSNICEHPYISIHISDDGETYCCCKNWCGSYSFGNIFNKSFNEIWFGEKAQNFREQFVVDKNLYCNKKLCISSNDNKINPQNQKISYPINICLEYDNHCNINCIFCNNSNKNINSELLKKIEARIEEISPELFSNAERVLLQGIGEALASSHSRKIIKKISELYPSIKFDILTNGILADEKNLTELGITNKIGRIFISFHAIKNKTYNKLIKKGNLDKIKRNIEYLYELKQKDKLESMEFRFVITSINYKEMILFAHFAKKYSAYVTFLNLIPHVENKHLFNKLNIINPNHPNYNDFINIIQNPIFKEDFVNISAELFKQKKIPFAQCVYNKIKNMITKEYKI